MPDLFAHALIAYTLCTLFTLRFDWITPSYVSVGMAGAFIPDLSKIQIIIPHSHVTDVLGIPFNWFALHTTGGALASIAIGGLLVTPRDRRRVLLLLAIGAGSHLLADALLITPSGRSYPILWPLTRYHPPTPGLYRSTQPEPMIVALLCAIVVTVATRGRRQSERS